jgi:transposase
MRGSDERTGELFSYIDLEQRVRADHPLRSIRTLVNEALASLDQEFAALYPPVGRPSVPPEKLLRAMLLQAFYSIRSERQLMERLEYDLLFRWFVGSVSRRRRGTIRASRPTATVCLKGTSLRSSWLRCWPSRGLSNCCRAITSRSTAR